MILSCSNISRSFGDNHILKRVSFHIEEHIFFKNILKVI